MPPQPIEISGTTLDRYIQGATLLRLLDPVRGDPTAYGLDQEARTIQGPFDRVIKRKFLDAVALICASEKSSNSISAACFDQDSSEGTGFDNVLLARNAITALWECDWLTKKADNKSVSRAHFEIELLRKIIKLVIARIRTYITEFQGLRALPRMTRADLQADIASKLPRLSFESTEFFLEWFCQIEGLINLRSDPDSEVLFGWIRWAEQARKSHMEILRAGFLKDHNTFPKWASYIFKLSRYGTAAKYFVKAATEVPILFECITVKAISAPPLVMYRVSESRQPLISVLRRIPEIESDSVLRELAKMWNTEDPERLFREKCNFDLAVHAELQIVRFYDENEQLKPRNRFIGVSKKSCYLCSTFLAYHTAGFVTSSCHQKMYLSIPPPSTNPKIYKRFKDLTSQICVRIESMAKEELVARLQLKLDRRSPVADSMAGISYADSLATRSWVQPNLNDLEDFTEFGTVKNTSVEDFGIVTQELVTHPGRGGVVGSYFSTMPLSQTFHETEALDSPSTKLRMPSIASETSMVFNFITSTGNDQELFMVNDILDPTTNLPSWRLLSKLLHLTRVTILYLRATDPPRIDASFQIYNERQLKVCIQHLSNAGILNVEISAYGDDFVADGSCS